MARSWSTGGISSIEMWMFMMHPLPACAGNSRKYTYIYKEVYEIFASNVRSGEIHRKYDIIQISCCVTVCTYVIVCIRTYTYKYCVYHYRNCWHDSHKTYSKYLAYAWRLWTWPAPNCCRLQKLGHTVERNLIQLAQTFNAKSQTLLGRLNPDPLICSQSTYPTFTMFYIVLPCFTLHQNILSTVVYM